VSAVSINSGTDGRRNDLDRRPGVTERSEATQAAGKKAVKAGLHPIDTVVGLGGLRSDSRKFLNRWSLVLTFHCPET
jgi:hypothetical protein